MASHQGLVAAGVIAGHDERMDYKAVPAATFTHPEVASVGLTEARAREAGHDVVVGRFPFAALGRAQTTGRPRGWSRWSPSGYREVLGVHIIGPSASDLIPEGVLAMHLEATLDDIADTIHAHPTLGESTMEAAMVALGLPVHLPPPAPVAGHATDHRAPCAGHPAGPGRGRRPRGRPGRGPRQRARWPDLRADVEAVKPAPTPRSAHPHARGDPLRTPRCPRLSR